MLTEYVGNAWAAYKRNFSSIIFAHLLMLLITSMVAVAGLLPLISKFPTLIGGGPESLRTALIAIVQQSLPTVLFTLLMIIVAFFLMSVLSGGLIRMYYEALKGKTKINTMLRTAKEKFFTIILADILVILLFGVGTMVFVMIIAALIIAIPAFLVLGVLLAILGILGISVLALFVTLFMQPIVIDNKGPWDSIRASYRIVRKNFTEFLGLVIVFAITAIVVSAIPFIGFLINLFLIAPVQLLSYTAFYLKRRR